jgi:peptide/nickel transport system ATP-binding protein
MIIDSITRCPVELLLKVLTMTPALLVDNLTVSLHGLPLVNGVSFTIEPGEKVALLGASGSGKSLTASALLGQLPPSMDVSGSLRIDGRLVPLRRRLTDASGLAAIHQNPLAALNPLVRLGSQLAIPLRKAGLSAQATRERTVELLTSVGIEDPERLLSSHSGELSGGQLQRVCIALALACRSSVLVADEPTTALDVVSQAKVLDVLAGPSASAQALLFITHDLAAAEALCTRALVMRAGRIVEEAPMDILLAQPAHSYTAQLVEAAGAGLDVAGLVAGRMEAWA